MDHKIKFQSHYRSDFILDRGANAYKYKWFQSHYRSDFIHYHTHHYLHKKQFQSHYRSDFIVIHIMVQDKVKYFNPIIGLILFWYKHLIDYGNSNFNPIIGLILFGKRVINVTNKDLFQSHYRLILFRFNYFYFL